MSEEIENPPAFPVAGSQNTPQIPGMTLRAYFAGQVMTSTQIGTDDKSIRHQATVCYKMADAMLKERTKK